MKRPFTVVSLFAGMGGSSLGYRMAGGRVLLAVERDPHAVDTYRENHPGTTVWSGDVKRLSDAEALRLAGLRPGELDVLDGSPPCQGFSIVGHRDPKDLRNQLYREYLRLLRAFRPRAFVMENVAGLTLRAMRPILKDIVAGMRSAGYEIEAKVLNAVDHGLPQVRRRIIFVGARRDLGIRPDLEIPPQRTPTIDETLKGCPKEKANWVNGMVLWLWTRCKPGEKLKNHHPNGAFFYWARLDRRGLCPTILSNPHLHWREPRYLTGREAMRLCGFPDSFVVRGSLDTRMKRIGNSVPPPFMRAIAGHVRATILEKGRKA